MVWSRTQEASAWCIAVTLFGASAAAQDDGGGDAGTSIAAMDASFDHAGLVDAALPPSVAPTEPLVQSLEASPHAQAVSEEPIVEVTVRGATKSDRMRASAENVNVIDTERAQRESSDLGALLARQQGISVQRAGALGSAARLSLNGLTDDQVRFFLDGVPLELAGYTFGVANVPVNLLERVEVYSGVVPIRFGADALGGAVNLVTDEDARGKKLTLSYQAGSFETQRAALSGRYVHAPSGFVVRIASFLDDARNDYPANVEVGTPQGAIVSKRLPRFHDGYTAGGGNAEFGFVRKRWAKRLLVRTFGTAFDKQLQTNPSGKVPYGAATYQDKNTGASLRYELAPSERVTFDAVAGYSFTRSRFQDLATCTYDWYGRCIQARSMAGETGVQLEGGANDAVYWTHSGFGRFHAGYRFGAHHALHVSSAPTYVSRTGKNLRPTHEGSRDAAAADRHLTTIVNGVEDHVSLFDERLENIAFVKQYVQLLRSEEPTSGTDFEHRARNTDRFGAGDSVRLRLHAWWYAKASYEYATRLPRPDQIFGNNAFIVPNVQLAPESSHNVNFSLTLDARDTKVGALRGLVNGFVRRVDDLIVLLARNQTQMYQNVNDATSRGFDASAGWTSLRDLLSLDANMTYIDFRNTSKEGAFAKSYGNRIPNRPYLLANASARTQHRNVLMQSDELSLGWTFRFSHAFYRTWEGVGLKDTKAVIPAQRVHSIVLAYLVRSDKRSFGATFEAQNVTNQRVFDFYGVQRPGRAFYLKTTAEF